jgi:nucleoside-diphosphate-sugar epimerase
MTTAIIGTGGIGSVIARQLASGGETLRLSSADHESARTPAEEIGRAAVVAVDNRDALQGADAALFALRFVVLRCRDFPTIYPDRARPVRRRPPRRRVETRDALTGLYPSGRRGCQGGRE